MKRLSFILGSLILAVVLVIAVLWTANVQASEVNQPLQPNYVVMFTDDFESGDGNWIVQSGDWAITPTAGGHAYQVTYDGSSPSTRRSYIADPESMNWTDYSVEARVWVSTDITGTSNYGMLMGRYIDSRNYYFMTMRGDGRIQIRQYYDGSSSGRTLAQKNDVVVPGEWFTATFELVGNDLRALINGTPHLTATHVSPEAFYTGTVALGSSKATAMFDDVVITDLRTFTLTVNTAGTGSGTVTSIPPGIDCGVTCTAVYESGDIVTLIPTPDGSSDFAGWQGACTGNGSCQVTMDAVKSVTAVFSSDTNPMLLVYKTGTGSGLVTSDPPGIDCGNDCAAGFTSGTVVTLTATAASDSAFDGWSGEGCTGTGECVVTMDQVRLVTASFTTYPLTANKPGNGHGLVTSEPPGIDCGITCTVNFAPGTVVTLTAVPEIDSTFDGWDGEGCSGTGDCVVIMDQARSVSATFSILPHTLTVNFDGNGDGSVSSVPPGIDDCTGPTCSADFPHSTEITLSAEPEALSDFAGWDGACSGSDCTLTLNDDELVTATFTLKTFDVSVVLAGTGTGVVTSIPAGIDCGVTCTATYTARDLVTLTAVADPGSTFVGWLGEGCIGDDPCELYIDSAKSVVAVFAGNPVLLVYKIGDGNGTVTSVPPGIDCGDTCMAAFTGGNVTLTATPADGSVFVGWCGACTGSGPCVVTMDGAKSVSALFADTTNVLLTEDFESGADRWTPTSGTWDVVDEGGNSVYQQSYPSGTTRSAVGDTSWTDYSVTAKVWVDAKYASLIARYMDDNHFYFMALRADNGKIEFKKWDGSGSIGMGSVNAGIETDQWYTATLEVVGDTLIGYLNGTPMITRTDTTGSAPFMYGAAGFGTLDSPAKFDDMVITSLVPKHILTIVQTGTGTGSVSSVPGVVDCDLRCMASLNEGTVITLTATADPGSVFAGWLGAGCLGTGPCVVTLIEDTTVTAVFSSPSAPMLVVNKTGNGSGTVTSDPPGIDCGEDCAAAFTPDAVVTLSATPDASSEFLGWSGAGCSGTGTCVVTMDTAKNVAANFQLVNYPLTVVKAGNVDGPVTSIPAGIDCGITCTAEFPAGTEVALTAIPDPGVYFHWSGDDCSGEETTCNVTIDGPKTVTATFNLYDTYMPLIIRYIEPANLDPLYVSPTGDDTNPGTITEPLKTLPQAISMIAAGQTVYLRDGTYEINETITLTAKGNNVNMYKIWAYENESPVLDFANSPAGSRGFLITGNYWHLKDLEIRYAQDNAIKIEGSFNIVENCSLHHNQDTGLQIGLGSTSSNPDGTIASYNQVINTDSYRNFDEATNGSNADGFAVKLFPGKGNTFYGCRAWENADDGWDLWETYFPVVIENSWTWHNGDPDLFGNPPGWGGNGNGFKLGGNFNNGAHIVKNCIAFDNLDGSAKGFDQNHNMSGVTIYNSVAWSNGVNFSFPEMPDDGTHHELQNNVAFAPGTQDVSLAADTINTHNSWNLPVTADAADFISLLVDLALAPRQADGSLPVNDFARLVTDSDLIDKGIDVGIPYLGLAPDLGAFEAK